MNYQEYWDERADEWLHQYNETTDLWKYIKPHIQQKWRVLEIGSGDGRWSAYFEHYTGIDVSPRLVDHSRKLYPKKSFIVRNIMNGILSGFDLVFSFTTLMNITEEDFKALIFPDTRMLIIEPHTASADHVHIHDYRTKGFTNVKKIGDRTLWKNYEN